jgi:hypothetical protein
MRVRNCSRCGLDHDDLALSPTNGDPIMVMLKNDDDANGEIPSGLQALEDALPVVYQVFCERRTANTRRRIAATRPDLASFGDSLLPGDDDELEAFKSTVREFFGKWKPAS